VLKGAKLRLDAEIGSLAIGGNEFIVLVPFTRMPHQRSSVCMASQEQGLNPPKQPEVSSAANSAWQDIMDDLSAMPTSPQSDAASKEFYSSRDPCSGRFTEDMTAGQSSSSWSSRKRRKTCKENGNGSPQMVSPEANGTAEKHNISKKTGVAQSAAMSCHVCITSFFFPLSATANFILTFITRRRKPNGSLVFLA
jgi:DEAD/DEAH box helicase domain-containing protein